MVIKLKWTTGDSTWFSEIPSIIARYPTHPVTQNAVRFARAQGWEANSNEAVNMARYAKGQDRHGEAGRWYARALEMTYRTINVYSKPKSDKDHAPIPRTVELAVMWLDEHPEEAEELGASARQLRSARGDVPRSVEV